jgi:hypothetical protein
MNEIRPKKVNLFKFFKSEGFNKARELFCAYYIIASYLNGIKEEADSLLMGYDGLFIGEMKKISKDLQTAFEKYEKTYRMFIGDALLLGETTIDISEEMDIQLKQSRFFLQEATKAIFKKLDEQVEDKVKDPEQIAKENFVEFEIFDKESRQQGLNATLNMARRRIKDFNGDPLKGVEVGWNTAVNYINRIYLNA